MCQPNAFNNPTPHMAIDATFVTVWGQLRTRRLHAKYNAAPSTPATIL